MSKEVVAEVIALIELGMIAPEDIVKCLRKANSEPAQRKPLTREQVKGLMTEAGYDTASPQQRADFINGIRHGEVAHGIKENT